MFVKGMEKSVFRFIPLTIIPLTLLRLSASAILLLRFRCGLAALRISERVPSGFGGITPRKDVPGMDGMICRLSP